MSSKQQSSLVRSQKVPLSYDVALAIGSAVIASGMVTPIILTIDKAVVQAAAGQMRLFPALIQGTSQFLSRPHKIFLSFPSLLVWSVYGATYIAANLLDVYNERQGVTGQKASMSKLFGTTAVNMSASLFKDVTFAKMFGEQVKQAAAESVKVVPPATYMIFLARDTLTIAGGFTVPPIMSAAITKAWGIEKSRSDKIAQLVSPMAMQLLCTPMHLLALNMYNEQGVAPAARAASVWKTLPSTTFIRMFRFLGAYGVGGIGNQFLVAQGRQWFENKQSHVVAVSDGQN